MRKPHLMWPRLQPRRSRAFRVRPPSALQLGGDEVGAPGLQTGESFDHVVEGRPVGQQHRLRKGHDRGAGFPVAFQLVETVAERLQPLGGKEPPEAARGDGFVEDAVEVLLLVDRAAGNALGAERLQEHIAGQPVET